MAKKKWFGMAAVGAAVAGVTVWWTKLRGKGDQQEASLEIEAIVEEVVVEEAAPETEDES
jgi:hypothetical protein